MKTPLDKYLEAHTSRQEEGLQWIEAQTHIRTNYPQMLSGQVQGRFLRILVESIRARHILEIGAFTGYSSACMALGLPEDGRIDTLEINDELESLMREGWERCGVSSKINLILGDAKKSLSDLAATNVKYDLAFMDANKREYCEYYGKVMEMMKPGGLIIADDVLWDGKVCEEHPGQDRQTQGILAFNDMVAADKRVESVILPLRDGLNIIRVL